MSKYQVIKTEFRDELLFREALRQVGVPFEHHAEPQHLVGYRH